MEEDDVEENGVEEHGVEENGVEQVEHYVQYDEAVEELGDEQMELELCE